MSESRQGEAGGQQRMVAPEAAQIVDRDGAAELALAHRHDGDSAPRFMAA